MSLNVYVYALSNPLKWIDPLGLSPVDASPMVTASSEANVSTGYVGGFVKGFLKTAAAAAVGIVAFAAAPVATAVVGTGLAVYGTVSNYQQRVAEQTAAGRNVNKLKTFGTAVLDTLGVSGLIEGITGKRMLTGQKLSSAQAGESLGSGVASVAAMVAGPALVKTIKPVVSKIVEPIKAAVSSFFSKAASAVKSAVSSLISKAPTATTSSSSALQTYYPPNDGFLGKPSKTVLAPGTRVDRFGPEGGRFVSPAGTPMEMRSLPPETQTRIYNEYEVARPLEVKAGRNAPWFGKPGLGTQYLLNDRVSSLVEQGKLRRVVK